MNKQTIKDGWLQNIRHCPSPNFGPRPQSVAIDMIVVHSISLPPGEYGGPEVEQLFTNQLDWDAHPYFDQIRGMEVSAHFFIRRDGQIVQFVSVDDRAWHAGRSSWLGRDNCNDYAIGIELEGLEGEMFEASQYQALAELIETLVDCYPITVTLGHEHIAPGRKKDPGKQFDWIGLKGLLKQHGNLIPEAIFLR